MSDLMEYTDERLSDTDQGQGIIAHIVRKSDQMRGYFEGQEITAMCGEKFIPTHDYKNKPVCKACVLAAERVIRGG